MDEYIGIIKLFAGGYAPRNWAFCNGAILGISTNQALFSIIGTTYGGDGRVTFALPNLKDMVPVGAGQGPNLAPIQVGQIGGSATVALSTAQIPVHTHTANLIASNTDATTNDPTGNMLAKSVASLDTGDILTSYIYAPPGSQTSTLSSKSINLSTAINGQGQQAQNQGHNNMMPYLGLNYIICIYGLFPPRN